MSCSPKYEKLVEYLKTHYTYQLKLNSFSLGNREQNEDDVKRQVYADVMEFIENLESEEELKDKHKNNLIPLDFSSTHAADTVPFNFTTDPVVFGTSTTYGGVFGSSAADTITLGGDTILGGSDTLNFGTPLPGGMGEDHISFSGVAGTQYDDPKYYADEHGLVAGELPDDKDDK
tara:strand:- start:61 stop:585 length:525 start_codon:yes stop_codon:yes gene_type:complete